MLLFFFLLCCTVFNIFATDFLQNLSDTIDGLNIFVYILVVNSQTVSLTFGPTPVIKGSPVTLNCSYSGQDQILYCSWSRNGTQITRLTSSCEERGGGPAVNSTLFLYTCPGGNWFTWTINSVTFDERTVEWACSMYYNNVFQVSNTVKLNVLGKTVFALKKE